MSESIDVTAAILRDGDRVFVARRAIGKHLEGLWEFPGGKVESGESNEQCLARELHEEFGIDVAVGSFFGESIFDYGDKVIRLLAYEASYAGGTFRLNDHDEMRWVSPSELSDFKWAPADVPFVEKLIEMESV